MEKGIFSGIDKVSIVKKIPLFSNLRASDLGLIADKSRIIEYKKDEDLYIENSPADAFYCIVSGRVKAYTRLSNGKENILEVLHRGEYFGIISLLTGEPHSVTTTTINDSIILKIDKEDFRNLLKKIPSLAICLSQTLSRRIKTKEAHPKTIFESNIVSVYSTSKGVGKSTYAVNLSISLKNETNKKVILLNINPAHHAVKKLLGISGSNRDLCLRTAPVDSDYVKSHIINHTYGIDLLNITHQSKDDRDKDYIIPLLGFLANEYHFIIVDLLFQMDAMVFKTLSQSDFIHLVSTSNAHYLTLTSKLVEELSKSIQNPQDKIKIIVNEAKPVDKLDNGQRKAILKHSIYATLPEIERLDADSEYLEGGPIVIKAPCSDYSISIRRISRDLGNVRVGIALGSGAALGLSQIGIIKVLEKENIPVDCVVGSSMGSLIGAFWASGKNASELEQIALFFKSKLATLKLIDPALPRSGLINGDEVYSFLKRNLGDKTFWDVKFPFKIVASDIFNRQIVILEEGPLADAVRISISIPGIFVPIRKESHILIDGGILNPIPVDVLVGMGIRKIIAIDTLPSPEDIKRTKTYQEEMDKKIKQERSLLRRIRYSLGLKAKRIVMPNIFDIIVNSIQSMEYSLSQSYLQQADLVLKPRFVNVNWYELFHADKLIKLGEEEAVAKLAQIKQLIKE